MSHFSVHSLNSFSLDESYPRLHGPRSLYFHDASTRPLAPVHRCMTAELSPLRWKTPQSTQTTRHRVITFLCSHAVVDRRYSMIHARSRCTSPFQQCARTDSIDQADWRLTVWAVRSKASRYVHTPTAASSVALCRRQGSEFRSSGCTQKETERHRTLQNWGALIAAILSRVCRIRCRVTAIDGVANCVDDVPVFHWAGTQ